MGIYRGAGGTGDATQDASSQAVITIQAKDAALVAQAAAETSATNASTSASNASTSATSASSSASSASTSASNASTSATNASSSASSASTSATTATTQAGIATTKASQASTSATNAASSASSASTSATNASNAQTAAEAARDSALSAYDNFDDRYLGPKSSDPTLDNDGNALLTGALYYNTTTNVMKVYTGSAWVAAYVSAAGVLLVANNLSDVASVSTSRTNLGVTATGSDTTYAYRANNLSDLASASTARTNLGLAIGSNVQAWDADLDAIGAIAGTSGFLKKTAANTWSLDTNTYLTSAVTSVTGTSPVVSSGGATPAISMAAANTTTSGYLTSTDWNTFNGKQAAGSYVTVGGALGTPSSGTLTNATGLPVGGISATGTPSSSTYLRGDGSWQAVSGSISVTGGDLTLSGNTGTAITNATLATVNSNTGSFGSTTSIPVITVNGKGLITAVSTATVSSLPSQTGNSGKYLTTDGTTASWGTVSAGAALSNDTSTSSNLYPLFAAATTGTPTTIYTSNSKYLYKPSTGDLSASQVVASNGLFLNNATVSTSYTVATGNNAMSVGPITVASGQSVTVSSGQRWVVL
jgi:hypothetical protein